MSLQDKNPDPDDMFADTRMSFGEHIEDLRTHLIRAGLGFLVALLASFFIGKYVLQFIEKPVKAQLNSYWERYFQKQEKDILAKVKEGNPIPQMTHPIHTRIRQRRRDFQENMIKVFPGLGKMAREQPAIDLLPGIERMLKKLDAADFVDWGKVPGQEWIETDIQIQEPWEIFRTVQELSQVVKPPTLTTLSVQEAFVVYFKVCIMTGFVLGSPWIFYQIWSFVAAGLYPHEKKYINIFLPFSLALFLGGVFLCEFFVMDKAIEALLWFNEWLGLAPDLRLNEWLGFAIFMPLVFGISFQTPLVMLFVQRVGVLTVDTFRSKRRIALFVLAIFAAIITPSTDPISMLLLWAPMALLYELGIALCLFLPGRPLLEFEVPESDELVEV